MVAVERLRTAMVAAEALTAAVDVASMAGADNDSLRRLAEMNSVVVVRFDAAANSVAAASSEAAKVSGTAILIEAGGITRRRTDTVTARASTTATITAIRIPIH